MRDLCASRERLMRSRFLIVPLALGFAYLPYVLAQHSAVAPSTGAAVVTHAAPMHIVPPAGAHSITIHTGSHSSIHSNTRMNSTARPVRSSSSATPAPTPKISWNASTSSGTTTTNNNLPQPLLPTYPPLVPNAPVLLPGNIFSGQSCFSPYNCFPVPGLGFDYEHFFATHPNWGSPILTAGVVVPFGGGGGFYLPIPYYLPAPVEQEEEPAANNENGNYNNGAANNGNGPQQNYPQQAVPQQQAAPAAAQGYYPPSEPVYEYVFVKRDGTRIFAVAYSLSKDKLSYVTREGLRRTLSLDALDFEATRKSNEERGNTVTLPSPPSAAIAAL